jgi:hypothetical protein
VNHIYLAHEGANTDHCLQCNGEEYEGNTGELNSYLVVEADGGTNVEVVMRYSEQALCDECAEAIKENKIQPVG